MKSINFAAFVNKFLLLWLLMSVNLCGCEDKEEVVVSTETGTASWYHPSLDGRRMSSGLKYNRKKLTAAHRKLPFGTRVRVTNLLNGKDVMVVITDRGPFIKDRIIDLSGSAADSLSMRRAGVVPVKLEVLQSRSRGN